MEEPAPAAVIVLHQSSQAFYLCDVYLLECIRCGPCSLMLGAFAVHTSVTPLLAMQDQLKFWRAYVN